MIPKLDKNLNVVQQLQSRPNLRDGLTDQELKAKFDEAANIIQKYINEKLVPAIDAKEIPFAGTNVKGKTVLEAIEWVKDQIAAVQLGEIGANSIPAEKLTAAVRNVLNSGVPVVGEEAPTVIADELPPTTGQLWLETKDGDAVCLRILLEDGSWYAFGYPVLPVDRGGTGKKQFQKGALLYGTGSEINGLPPSDGETPFLALENGIPTWKSKENAQEALGILRVKEITYEGTYSGGGGSTVREVELDVIPVLLFVYNTEGSWTNSVSKHDTAVSLVQNAEVVHTFNGVHQTAKLVGGKLILTSQSEEPEWLNRSGCIYVAKAFY